MNNITHVKSLKLCRTVNAHYMSATVINFVITIIILMRLGHWRGRPWKTLTCKKPAAINLWKILILASKHKGKNWEHAVLTWWEGRDFRYRAICNMSTAGGHRIQELGKKINRNTWKNVRDIKKPKHTVQKQIEIKRGGRIIKEITEVF